MRWLRRCASDDAKGSRGRSKPHARRVLRVTDIRDSLAMAKAVFTFSLLVFLLSSIVGTSASTEVQERKQCISNLKKLGAERWCASPERKECLNMHGAEWCDTSTAAHAEKEILNKRLNATYKAVMSSLEEHQRKSLRESQHLWLQSHVAECNARNDQIPGGVAIMRNNVWLACINEFIKKRTTELKTEFCQNDKGC